MQVLISHTLRTSFECTAHHISEHHEPRTANTNQGCRFARGGQNRPLPMHTPVVALDVFCDMLNVLNIGCSANQGFL